MTLQLALPQPGRATHNREGYVVVTAVDPLLGNDRPPRSARVASHRSFSIRKVLRPFTVFAELPLPGG
jgi:hypothetical protein